MYALEHKDGSALTFLESDEKSEVKKHKYLKNVDIRDQN